MSQYYFNKIELAELARINKEKYQKNKPCPHIYIDNFLKEETVQELKNEFPKPEDSIWKNKYNDQNQFKMACEDSSKFPKPIKHILQQFNSSEFINFLEELTGIDGLIPDPHYRGGGMHQIIPGGFLKVHVDFNWYPRLRLERRVNVLIYLNDNWKEEYGGCFELWDKDMKNSEVKILPIINRVAIFSTSEESFHGHPDPLSCPDGMSRKSLALYYYTSPAQEEQAMAKAHSTLFKERPNENIQVKNSLFKDIKILGGKVLRKIGIKK